MSFDYAFSKLTGMSYDQAVSLGLESPGSDLSGINLISRPNHTGYKPLEPYRVYKDGPLDRLFPGGNVPGFLQPLNRALSGDMFGTLVYPEGYTPTPVGGSSSGSASSGNQISASIQPDVDKIQDDEVESIRNQWQSFLAEYERIIGEANDQQLSNWQAAADWNERMYRDQWKMQVEGLREAGINPLMMAGALRASSVPQMSAASVVAPSFPSNEFSATANTEIAGLYSLYATLQTLDSEERRAELARILGYAELSQKAADSILRFIGSFVPSTCIIKRG